MAGLVLNANLNMPDIKDLNIAIVPVKVIGIITSNLLNYGVAITTHMYW
jgi:hypothetical protein